LLALALAAATLCLQWPLRELGFAVLSGEPGVEQAGRDYFDGRIWGAPATLCNFALIGWFLGRARSRYVLLVAVVGNLANIALSYVPVAWGAMRLDSNAWLWFAMVLFMAARTATLGWAARDLLRAAAA